MTETEFRHALQLIDSATRLLQQHDPAAQDRLRAELRRLALKLDLLRAQVTQAPVESRRN